MASYHFSAQVLSRSTGRSAVGAAAYRHGTDMEDERTGERHDYRHKHEAVHSEILFPEDAPAWVKAIGERAKTDIHGASAQLWNKVEVLSKRRDAQLAREIDLALPRELTREQSIELTRAFVQQEFADRGMVADWSLHDKRGNPHAHVLLTMRPLAENGFAPKTMPVIGTHGEPMVDRRGKTVYREALKFGVDELTAARESWSGWQNEALAYHGHDRRVDHRSFEDRGIDLEPTKHIGVHAKAMEARGIPADRERLEQERAARNVERIRQNPETIIKLVAERQSAFTKEDLRRETEKFLGHTLDARHAMESIDRSPLLVKLTRDHFSTKETIASEQRTVDDARRLHGQRQSVAVDIEKRIRLHDSGSAPDQRLTDGQKTALRHVTDRDHRIAIVQGDPGTGKSTMLRVAKSAWEDAGLRVMAAAPTNKAVLELREKGMEARTADSLLRALKSGKETLDRRTVLVLDEANMTSNSLFGELVGRVQAAGGKFVTIGDSEQLQSIGRGGMFRHLSNKLGAARMSDIVRQKEGWQRDAVTALHNGDALKALTLHEQNGDLKLVQSRAMAIQDAAREAASSIRSGHRQTVILGHANATNDKLNVLVRGHLKAAGDLQGPEVAFKTEVGERRFAKGDRVLFLATDRSIGVATNNTGTVETVGQAAMTVRLDGEDRSVSVSPDRYSRLDHGYATTVHRAEGMTTTRTIALVTPGFDRHLGLIALSRQSESVKVFAGRDDFATLGRMAVRLNRTSYKLTTCDVAEIRGREPDSAPRERRVLYLRAQTRPIARLEQARLMKRWRAQHVEQREMGFGAALRSLFGGKKQEAQPAQQKMKRHGRISILQHGDRGLERPVQPAAERQHPVRDWVRERLSPSRAPRQKAERERAVARQEYRQRYAEIQRQRQEHQKLNHDHTHDRGHDRGPRHSH